MNKDVNEIISYATFVCRNIKSMPFPSKLRTEEARELAEKISKSLLKNKKYKFKKVNLWEESKEKCISYLENLIISKEMYKNKRFATLLITEDQKIIVLINEINHIKIITHDRCKKFQELYNISLELIDTISNDFDFEYDDILEYLTSDVEKIGTGLTVSSILHLPILNKTSDIKDIIKEYQKQEVIISDVFVEDIENIGNIYSIENKITLGIKPNEILSDIEAVTQQIIMREKKLRNALLEVDSYEVYDLVFRAKGVLMNARKITYKEALKNISMLRLGVELKIINDVNIKHLAELSLAAKCNRMTNEKNDSLKINVERANHIRSVFSDI